MSLVAVRTPEEVTKERKAQEQSVAPAPPPELISFLHSRWDAAKRAKDPVEREMLEALRQRSGEYDAARLAQIKALGGSEAFDNLTDTKCAAAIAWIDDLLMQTNEKLFSVEPTPVPELPEAEVQKIYQQIANATVEEAIAIEAQTGQQTDINQLAAAVHSALQVALEKVAGETYSIARTAAEKMDKLIEDQLVEADFNEQLMMFVEDLITMPAGILKGPVERNLKTLAWGDDDKLTTAMRVVKQVDAVDPFDIYPSPGATSPNDGDLFQRHRLEATDLVDLIGVPGYDEKAIRMVLERYALGGLRDWLFNDTERNRLQGRPGHDTFGDTAIDCLECWMAVPGSLLAGKPGFKDVDRSLVYQVHLWLVGDQVIKGGLNKHPMGLRPYAVRSFRQRRGSFWGHGLPWTIRHDQDNSNITLRAAMDNVAFASGPMCEENVDRLAPGAKPGQLYPRKTYLTTDELATGSPAVRFFSPPMVAGEMLQVRRVLREAADDHSMIPAYAHGNDSIGGAGNTASGFSMMLGMASKGIKHIVRNVDKAVTTIVEGFYYSNLVEQKDPLFRKCDLRVVARGSSSLAIKEMMLVRRRELLQATANEIDLQILGPENRRKLIFEMAKDMGIELDPVVPTPQPPQGAMGQSGQPTEPTLDAAGNPAGGADMQGMA